MPRTLRLRLQSRTHFARRFEGGDPRNDFDGYRLLDGSASSCGGRRAAPSASRPCPPASPAPAAPLAIRAQNALYPLHSARMAGSPLALPLRVAMTLAGLGLALLGSLAMLTFWRAPWPRKNPARPRVITGAEAGLS